MGEALTRLPASVARWRMRGDQPPVGRQLGEPRAQLRRFAEVFDGRGAADPADALHHAHARQARLARDEPQGRLFQRLGPLDEQVRPAADNHPVGFRRRRSRVRLRRGDGGEPRRQRAGTDEPVHALAGRAGRRRGGAELRAEAGGRAAQGDVPRAAAEIARQRLAGGLLVEPRRIEQKCGQRHHDPRRAEAALRRAFVHDRLLDRVEPLAVEALDGDDMPVDRVARGHEAGIDRAVAPGSAGRRFAQQDQAGAAIALAAALAHARQPQAPAQDVQQDLAGGNRQVVRLVVDEQLHSVRMGAAPPGGLTASHL